MELTVKLQVFEGPLDLLLHLLDKNKVNIYDIPIVEITNQYMEYIREMKRQDLNVMSEFLVMAATLIDIKSKMLLPAKGKVRTGINVLGKHCGIICSNSNSGSNCSSCWRNHGIDCDCKSEKTK